MDTARWQHSIGVRGQGTAETIAKAMVNGSRSFYFSPLPDDCYEFLTKREHVTKVEEIAGVDILWSNDLRVPDFIYKRTGP